MDWLVARELADRVVQMVDDDDEAWAKIHESNTRAIMGQIARIG